MVLPFSGGLGFLYWLTWSSSIMDAQAARSYRKLGRHRRIGPSRKSPTRSVSRITLCVVVVVRAVTGHAVSVLLQDIGLMRKDYVLTPRLLVPVVDQQDFHTLHTYPVAVP
jgi:hypothetical protein